MSDKTIAALVPPQAGQVDYYDHGKGKVPGLLLKVSKGTKTFYLLYRPKGKKGSRQQKIGRYPALKLADARNEARKLQGELAKDAAYLEKKKQAENVVTFADVVEKFRVRYVEAEGLRTGKVMLQQIDKHLMPTFKARDFHMIRRSEISDVLDKIQDRHGAAMADRVLTVFKSIASFWSQRDEDYRSPLARGMRRYDGKARERVLNDDEIRSFWKATGNLAAFGNLARLALVTGQRRSKLAEMKWSDIREGVWIVGRQQREKPNVGMIKLAPLALEIIAECPRLERNPHIFPATRARGPFNDFATSQTELIEAMRRDIPDMEEFTFHDLRRTFRSRCSRIGINREIAERALGHVVGTAVERTYDVHRYEEEIASAFAAVASHVLSIVHPPSGNVIRMERPRH